MAGLLGGYALANALSVALVAPWSLPRADAVLVAMQLSFAVYALAVMGAFAARSARRAWVLLGAATLASAAVSWAMR
ncbi:MAG TPA: iron transporter [Pseudorhodoferax sp.]|nr:iron transporter [Pseudorhodoferax sp.]